MGAYPADLGDILDQNSGVNSNELTLESKRMSELSRLPEQADSQWKKPACAAAPTWPTKPPTN